MKVSVAITLAAFVAVALADSQYAKPAYEAKPAYQSYNYAPSPYSFSYAVKDEPSYNDFGHSETSDGKVVTGSYSVVLPDGRKQIVTYKVDAYSGYVAEVKYEGVAKYPEYKAYAAPAPYKPVHSAPAYSAPAAPAYKAPAAAPVVYATAPAAPAAPAPVAYTAPAATKYEAPAAPAPAKYEAPAAPAPVKYEASAAPAGPAKY